MSTSITAFGRTVVVTKRIVVSRLSTYTRRDTRTHGRSTVSRYILSESVVELVICQRLRRVVPSIGDVRRRSVRMFSKDSNRRPDRCGAYPLIKHALPVRRHTYAHVGNQKKSINASGAHLDAQPFIDRVTTIAQVFVFAGVLLKWPSRGTVLLEMHAKARIEWHYSTMIEKL